MCLNEAYHKVRISYSKWSESRRCFIANSFNLNFKIRCSEGPRKL